jgi:hypothetical protein
MWSALGNELLNGTAQWQSDGGGRGTWDILSTCLATLILCVWTAVHMNIPREGNADSLVWKKIWYMSTALVIPELVCKYFDF